MSPVGVAIAGEFGLIWTIDVEYVIYSHSQAIARHLARNAYATAAKDGGTAMCGNSNEFNNYKLKAASLIPDDELFVHIYIRLFTTWITRTNRIQFILYIRVRLT